MCDHTEAGSDYDGAWSIAHLTCGVCDTQVKAHSPVTAHALECPACGHMMPAPALPCTFDADGHPVLADRDLFDVLKEPCWPDDDDDDDYDDDEDA